MLAGFVYGAIPSEERAALIALYDSTSGDGWTNRDGWKGNHNEPDGFSKIGSEGNWYGITVNKDHVTSIDLNHNNMVGTIPAELGNLPNLSQLYLYYNRLSGSIPPELGNLNNLKRLYLFNNQLTGSIPAALGNLSNLLGLSLVFNQLSGEIPPRLGNLSKLKWLYLYFNQLTGDIPGELGQLEKLEELYLNDNQLDGTIPPELGSCSNLQILYLSSNQLMGNIPGELGNLKKLVYLILNNNMLTGNIPPQLGNLTSLKKLYLNYNILEGKIPPDLEKLSKLEELYLNDNILDGMIPSDLGDISSLKILYLSRNQLTGGIPADLGNLSYLEGLYLNDNQLSGEIPTALGDLLNLKILYLSSNRLTGSIPGELGKLKNLLVLQLNSNQLQVGNTSNLPNITSLKNLLDELSDFRWNALYTDNKDMKDFLKSKQWDEEWENTQTILPTNITASPVSANSIEVSWTPILYSVDPGGYEVFYSLDKDGPYTKFGDTTTKKDSRLEVTGLNPLTTYYFKVQTRTDPHSKNNNTVLSEISAEVSAPTSDVDKTISGKVTDAAGVGMEGVTLTFSSPGAVDETEVTQADGKYEHQVPHGWKVTVTPSKDNSLFYPRYLEYLDVTENKSDQDYRLILSLTLSASWEEDKTTLIKIDYGKISLSYSLINPGDMALKEFIIYRKVSGGVYEAIKSFPTPVDKVSGEISYNDKCLDKNKTYTYIARATDNFDNVLVESNEITISANK